MSVIEIQSYEQLENLIKNIKELIVIDFNADWCRPCQNIKPKFHDLSKQYKNVTFCSVNIDEQEEISQKYQISRLPTFLFIKNQKIINNFCGANEKQLEKNIKDNKD